MRISDWSSDVCSSDLLYDIEAIIKILTKPAGLNFFLQLAVCGGDDAHVDLQRHACADRLGFAIFRSEERRGGKEWVSPCRSRWVPYHSKKKHDNKHKH